MMPSDSDCMTRGPRCGRESAWRPDCRGQATVEFAIVISVFLLLLFGAIEVSRAVYEKQALARGAEVIARQLAQTDPETNVMTPTWSLYASDLTAAVDAANTQAGLGLNDQFSVITPTDPLWQTLPNYQASADGTCSSSEPPVVQTMTFDQPPANGSLVLAWNTKPSTYKSPNNGGQPGIYFSDINANEIQNSIDKILATLYPSIKPTVSVTAGQSQFTASGGYFTITWPAGFAQTTGDPVYVPTVDGSSTLAPENPTIAPSSGSPCQLVSNGDGSVLITGYPDLSSSGSTQISVTIRRPYQSVLAYPLQFFGGDVSDTVSATTLSGQQAQ
jgi:Flp pilus assembly protein TadG